MKILIVISLFLSVIIKSQSLDSEISEKLVTDDIFNVWSQTFSNLTISNFKETETHIFNETDFFDSQKDYPSYIQELFSFSPNKKMENPSDFPFIDSLNSLFCFKFNYSTCVVAH